MLSEAANRTKKGGQELIGGIDVRVNRNYYGRQVESFEADIDLPFLQHATDASPKFRGIFIRAPVVERVLPPVQGVQIDEESIPESIVAPSQAPRDSFAAEKLNAPVEVLASLPGRARMSGNLPPKVQEQGDGDIIAVRQGNVFGVSFHPELTLDCRIHAWWLQQVKIAVEKQRAHG